MAAKCHLEPTKSGQQHQIDRPIAVVGDRQQLAQSRCRRNRVDRLNPLCNADLDRGEYLSHAKKVCMTKSYFDLKIPQLGQGIKIMLIVY